ncbi:MAG: MBL fold metallo-hydrolase [Candidatus Omnitrophota bacterium]
MKKGPLIFQMPVGGMENFCYLVADPGTREAVCIDPAWEPETILARIREEKLRLAAILCTHFHDDHTNAVPALVRACPVPVHMHEADARHYGGRSKSFRMTRDGEVLHCGGLEIGVLHTPGHTPGGQCFHIGGNLFTGDTLFITACGRCDFPFSDPKAMYASLTQKIAALPDETVIYPGHDYSDVPSATLGEVKRINPYMKLRSEEQFLRFRMAW